MKRILLTGATGFIGRQCIPLLLSQGYEVHAVSSRRAARDDPPVLWHQADLLDPPQASRLVSEVRPSHLLHLAWYTVPGHYWTSGENLRWVQASLGLLQAFGENGGQRVVMAGTCAEYDWQHGICSESVTPLSPTTLYGTCKHSLQLMLTAFSRETTLSAAWGRIFFVFGPHEAPDRLVAYVIQSLLQKTPARCSHGDQVRDFLYVQDVANAFVSLVESAVSGPVNIASGRPTVLRDVIGKIGELLHRPDLIQLGTLPAREDEPALLVADVGRLTKEVGWAPQYDLTSGLERTIEWWKGQMAQNNMNRMNECPH